jgi:hypothetical protein
MAKKRANKPVTLAGARTKSQVTAQREQNAEVRNQTIAENQQLKKSDEGFASTYGAKEQGYYDLKDSLNNYPDAVSHSTVHHDRLLNHITELTTRAQFVNEHEVGADSAYDKKLGITQAVQSKVQRATPALMVHLTAAKEQLNRALAAHADGAAGGAAAYHTAHQAMIAAHSHVLDAHRHLSQTGTIEVLGSKPVGNEGRLMRPSELAENLKGYENELGSSAVNKRVDLPAGVLTPSKPDIGMDSGYSPVGQKLLRSKNLPATPEEAEQKQAADRTLARKIAMSNFREAAHRGVYTPTKTEMDFNEQQLMYDKGDPRSIGRAKPNPYAGVGTSASGLSEVKAAAKAHYTQTTGNSFEGSGLENHDPKTVRDIAERHWSENGASRRANAKKPNFSDHSTALAYANTHASDDLVASHPAVQYALKHNLGVMNNPQNRVAKALRLMGETELAPSVDKILGNRIATSEGDPTNPRSKEKRMQSLDGTKSGEAFPTPTPNVSTKEGRSAIFSNAVTGGN